LHAVPHDQTWTYVRMSHLRTSYQQKSAAACVCMVLATPMSVLFATSVGVQALVSTLLILAASYAFHFDIMWQNSFWLSFLLLLLTNLALVSFCFFIR